MTFEEYCAQKKIDHQLFAKAEPDYYESLKSLFLQLHPNSFTDQKKFLINQIRRKYQLKEVEKVAAKPTKKVKPIIPSLKK